MQAAYRSICSSDPMLKNLMLYENFMAQNLAQSGGVFRLLLHKPE
jgi:hypothetical protein